jgi:hypothetical protein
VRIVGGNVFVADVSPDMQVADVVPVCAWVERLRQAEPATVAVTLAVRRALVAHVFVYQPTQRDVVHIQEKLLLGIAREVPPDDFVYVGFTPRLSAVCVQAMQVEQSSVLRLQGVQVPDCFAQTSTDSAWDKAAVPPVVTQPMACSKEATHQERPSISFGARHMALTHLSCKAPMRVCCGRCEHHVR